MHKCSLLLLPTKISNLETIPLNNDRISLVNTKFQTKKLANCCLILLPYKYTNNLTTQRSIKKTVNLENLNFKKKIYRAVSKLCASLFKVVQNVYKTANKCTSINTNQILLSRNRLELSPWCFTHVFEKFGSTMRWNCTWKALRFLACEQALLFEWAKQASRERASAPRSRVPTVILFFRLIDLRFFPLLPPLTFLLNWTLQGYARYAFQILLRRNKNKLKP